MQDDITDDFFDEHFDDGAPSRDRRIDPEKLALWSIPAGAVIVAVAFMAGGWVATAGKPATAPRRIRSPGASSFLPATAILRSRAAPATHPEPTPTRFERAHHAGCSAGIATGPQRCCNAGRTAHAESDHVGPEFHRIQAMPCKEVSRFLLTHLGHPPIPRHPWRRTTKPCGWRSRALR